MYEGGYVRMLMCLCVCGGHMRMSLVFLELFTAAP